MRRVSHLLLDVLTAVTTRSAVFWIVTPWGSDILWRFGGAYDFNLQCRTVSQARSQQKQEASSRFKSHIYVCRYIKLHRNKSHIFCRYIKLHLTTSHIFFFCRHISSQSTYSLITHFTIIQMHMISAQANMISVSYEMRQVISYFMTYFIYFTSCINIIPLQW